tara:strand:- start:2970 stop:3815 length:846 start_codon:yes stop_codon:yes gene_type:complete
MLIIFSLIGTIAYLKYIHIKNLEILNINLERVKSRSTSLVEKLKETGQRGSKWEQQVLSQSSKQKKLNEQQASLIEKQAEEISDLKSILQQREQVVQQFQTEKTSTQDQINNLQLRIRSLEQQLRSTEVSLTESKSENENVRAKIGELENELRKFELKDKQRSKKTTATVKILKSKSIANPPVKVERLKIDATGGKVKVSFYLTNKSKKLEIGRAGMFLSSPKNLEKDISLSLENSIPYKIKRYRVIRRTFTKVKSGTLLRIMVWNAKNKPIVDEAYPIVQ